MRERVSNAVHHEKRAAIAAKAQHSLDLKRADAFFRGTEKVHATSHFRSGMCESSKIVPTVTVNCFLQMAHWRNPARTFALSLGLISQNFVSSAFLQCGQTIPLGQRISSKYWRAFSSDAKRILISSSVKSSGVGSMDFRFMRPVSFIL